MAMSKKSAPTVREFRQWQAPSSQTERLIEDYLAGLNSPVSLSVWLMYHYGEHDQLVAKDVDPGQYNDPDRFRRDFLAVMLLRKSTFLKTSIDRRQTAIDSFKAAERQCKETNERFRSQRISPKPNGDMDWLLNATRLKIAAILGRFDVDEFLDKCTWGPGVTLSVKGDETSWARKFLVDRDITKDAHYLFAEVLSKAYPLWDLSEMNFAVGNRIHFVPKNAKTDRTIAIEPGINSWIQLGCGKCIRSRLRRAGYNLNSDLKNQRQAYIGSVNGKVATVDFKAASDTISTAVVEELIPRDWLYVLDAARSKMYLLDGSFHRSEKFSTMGCGFTFELESLIFVSAALSCCEFLDLDKDSVSIFGDDVTLPVEAVEKFSQFCKYLGFTVNTQKSYSSGYFRESCGSYYFAGLDVKPLFLKERIRNVRQVFTICNSLFWAAFRGGFCHSLDDSFRRGYDRLHDCLPVGLRLYGGLNETDGAFIDFSQRGSYRKLRDGWEGFHFRRLASVPVCVSYDHVGLLIARLKSGWSDVERKNDVELRSRTRLAIIRGWCRQQCDRLDWETI